MAQIRILGTEKAIANAKMLIELHGKHVSDMQRVYSEREQLSAKLQQERDRLTTGCRLDFPIERELIGLVVGKNGATIQAARKATGVHRVEVSRRALSLCPCLCFSSGRTSLFDAAFPVKS